MPRKIEVRNRRNRIRRIMLKGNVNVATIAEKEKVSKSVVRADMTWVMRQWAIQDEKMYAADGLPNSRRAYRVAMLMEIVAEAAESFEKTKGEVKETTTTMRLLQCPACKSKAEDREGCPTCDGNGSVQTTIVTEKTKYQAGDPSYLKIMKDCIAEIGLFEGLKVHNLNVNIGVEGLLRACDTMADEELQAAVDFGMRIRGIVGTQPGAGAMGVASGLLTHAHPQTKKMQGELRGPSGRDGGEDAGGRKYGKANGKNGSNGHE